MEYVFFFLGYINKNNIKGDSSLSELVSKRHSANNSEPCKWTSEQNSCLLENKIKNESSQVLYLKNKPCKVRMYLLDSTYICRYWAFENIEKQWAQVAQS